MKSIWIIIVILVIVAALVYFWRDESENTTNGQGLGVCTLDAMLCPDGSYVGRVPPDCDFAACPTAASSTNSTEATLNVEL